MTLFRSDRRSSVDRFYRNPIARDALLIFLLVVPAFFLSVHFSAFEKLYEITRDHEDWQLDHIIMFGILFAFGATSMLFSAARRMSALKREVGLRMAAENLASRLARQDALTGLPNRRQFIEELGSWKPTTDGEASCAVFIVDLDRFKPVNDLYGHYFGDEVLRTVAARLKDIAGEDALIARLGGDEFGILLRFTDRELPSAVARRIVDEISRPIKFAGLSVQVGACVGIAIQAPEVVTEEQLAVNDGSGIQTLMRQADMAMYRAKTDGRSMYHFYEREMDQQLYQRVLLERDIKRAVETGQIVPYYQPLIDLKSGDVLGFEVLARWEHPTHGLLPPSILIPIVEDTGLISEMTFMLLRRAIRDAKTWPDSFMLSINLSPRQFANMHLAEEIMGILAEHAFPAHRLEIEITENALVDRIDEAKLVLTSLRNIGVRVALDDFGSGYSGLFHLRQFKIDTIKIDRSLVTDMLSNAEDDKLVEAIMSVTQTLRLDCTAEGIETVEVRNRLVQLGCSSGQGFYYSKPLPYAEVQRYLSNLHKPAIQVA